MKVYICQRLVNNKELEHDLQVARIKVVQLSTKDGPRTEAWKSVHAFIIKKGFIESHCANTSLWGYGSDSPSNMHYPREDIFKWSWREALTKMNETSVHSMLDADWNKEEKQVGERAQGCRFR